MTFLDLKGQSLNDSLTFYSNNKEFEKAVVYGKKNLNHYIASQDKISIYNLVYANTHLGFKNYKSFSKAEPFFKEAYALALNYLGKDHPGYYSAITNLAIVYFSQGKYNEAGPLFFEIREITKAKLGVNHPDYVRSLYALATLYKTKGRIDDAEKLYLEILQIRKNTSGINNPDYAASLNSLALLYSKNGQYKKAETFYIKALEIRKNTLGTLNLVYSTNLYNLALVYEAQGFTDKAKTSYLKVLNIGKKEKNTYKDIYSLSLDHLAKISKNNGFYKEASTYFEESLLIKKKYLGKTHPQYVKTLTNLSNLYNTSGEYLKAETGLLEVLNITNKRSENDHDRFEMARLYHNFGFLYMRKGDYKKSEIFFLKALTYEDDSKNDYANTLDNLAMLYLKQGNYKKAKSLSLRSIEIFKSNNNDPLGYAMSLNDLATIYTKLGKYQNALPLFMESKSIREELLGVNDPIYLNSVNNLAELYQQMDYYKKAEVLYLEVLNKRKEILGVSHPHYALTLYNLGSLFEDQKRYNLAEDYYFKALELRKKMGRTNPAYIVSLKKMAFFYFDQGKYSKALLYFEKSFYPVSFQVRLASSYLSSNEIMNYLKKTNEFNNASLSLLNLNPDSEEYSNLTIGNLNLNILLKNNSLRNSLFIKNNIQNSKDSILRSEYSQFIENKKNLALQASLPKDQRSSSFDQITTETEQLEKQLLRKSSAYSDNKKAISIKWSDIKKQLKPREIVIDLVSFNNYDKKWTNSIIYGAFVFKKGYQTPKYIRLFEEKQLTANLKKSNIDSNVVNTNYLKTDLSDLFLKPIGKDLNDITTIYLSPSGLAHQVNFSALQLSNNITLGEKYNVHIFGSSAEILNYQSSLLLKDPKPEILLYGDIDYDNMGEVNNPNNKNTYVHSGRIIHWGNLSGTAVEIKKIQNLAKRNSFKTHIVDDQKATKNSILKLDGRQKPFVLHLATHGYFFPDPKKELLKDTITIVNNEDQMVKKNIYKDSEDPMLRSGLLFAGANKYWDNKLSNATSDNGILTAREISNLDLTACELVVMSACDTGLGATKGSEGVFGLQRAFKMAGVKNIIMSLWQVPDKQTAELFEEFYKLTFTGKSIHEAFKLAQEKMKEKYSPYNWAGFVLLE